MSIRVDMTMSLDGYVTGPDDGPDAPMGTGGFRPFNWLDKRNHPGPSGEGFAGTPAPPALISRRRTDELAGHRGGDPPKRGAVFVLAPEGPRRTPPGPV